MGLPSLSSFPMDAWIVGSVIVTAGALVTSVWLFQGARAERARLEEQTVLAVEDSIRFHDLNQQAQALLARRDSVARRVSIIQEIDQNRFLWAHILDEVARALPEFTWLTGVEQQAADAGSGGASFVLRGNAGNNRAITTFMESLEASPFIQRVSLGETELVASAEGSALARNVYQFSLRAEYEYPPLEFLATEPLFRGTTVLPDSGAASASAEQQGG